MRVDRPPVAELLQVAASTVPQLERARGLVQSLDRWLPVDAIWLTLCDPASAAYAAVGSRGLDRPVLDYLGRPSPPRDLQPAAPDRARSPISVTELPVPVAERPT